MGTTTLQWFSRASIGALLLAAGCSSPRYRAGSDMAMLAPDALVDESPGAPVNPGVVTSDASANSSAGEPANESRLMVYSARLQLVVSDVPGTLDKLTAMAADMKGYMQEMNGWAIQLRIPAARFNEALQSASALGEVTRREIKGDDVTEQMLDFQIRLKNMEQVRERLLKLLEKGEKVEDLLKVSHELERVTENIERLKGRLQFLQNQVSYSTLRVELNSVLPQKEQAEVFPFEWVRRLGTEITETRGNIRPESRLFPWMRFDLPPSYVKLQEYDDSTRAMSGEGVMLLVKREENFEGGTVEFWSQIIRRWLAGNSVVAVAEQKEIVLDTGARGTLFVGTKTFGRKTYTYWMSVFVRGDEVYTFECWGLSESILKDQAALEKTLKSLRIKP